VTAAEGGAVTEVRAAGGVVWRWAGSTVEFLLIHRPRYDDWSLPKGKTESDDEGWRRCAEREVEEETGHRCPAGRRVDTVRYHDRRGRAKEVRYYAMEVGDDAADAFRPNDEVDEIAWLKPEKARSRMTRASDVAVLDAFLAGREPEGGS
jgi:8-oxo-dGTP diphosphatase